MIVHGVSPSFRPPTDPICPHEAPPTGVKQAAHGVIHLNGHDREANRALWCGAPECNCPQANVRVGSQGSHMIRRTGPGSAPCPVAMDAVLCSSAGRLISAGPVELAGTATEVQQFTDAERPAMGHSGTEGE